MSDEFAEFVVPEALKRRRERQRERARERYHTDADYRARKRSATRARYIPVDKKKTKKRRVRRKARGRNKPRPYTLPDGRVILLVGLGQAADTIGLTKKTLRGYEEKGVIPINRRLDSRGRRWYPQEFVDWLAPMFVEQSKRREPLWSLRQRVERSWMDIIRSGNMPILTTHQENASD